MNKGPLIAKPHLTLADVIQLEIVAFTDNCPTANEDLYSHVLCFPATTNIVESKCIRYIANIYGLVAIYLGPKEAGRVCVLKKSCLKPDIKENFNKYFSTSDEDVEPINITHLNFKLTERRAKIHQRDPRYMRNLNAAAAIDFEHQIDPYSSASTEAVRDTCLNAMPVLFDYNEYDSHSTNDEHRLPDGSLNIPLYPSEVEYGKHMIDNRQSTKTGKKHSYQLHSAMDSKDFNVVFEDLNFQSDEKQHMDTMKSQSYIKAKDDIVNKMVKAVKQLVINVDTDTTSSGSEVSIASASNFVACNNSTQMTQQQNEYENYTSGENFHFNTEEMFHIIRVVLNMPGLPAIETEDADIELVHQFVTKPLIVMAAYNYDTVRSRFNSTLEYIIEIYNIPLSFKTHQVLNLYLHECCHLKWCDDTHALLITSSSSHALRALTVKHPVIQSREITKASPIGTLIACGTHFRGSDTFYSLRQKSKAIVKINDIFEKRGGIFEGFIELPPSMQPSQIVSLTLNHCNLIKMPYFKDLVNLNFLNLSFNKIKTLEGFTYFPRLQILTLSYNYIENIAYLENAPILDVLIINNNKLKKIENLDHVPLLRFLELEGNQIHVIQNLNALPGLIKLNLSDNLIVSVAGLEYNYNLEVLNLSNNLINDVYGVSHLINLARVNIKNNRISDWKLLKMFNGFPKKIFMEWSNNPLPEAGQSYF